MAREQPRRSRDGLWSACKVGLPPLILHEARNPSLLRGTPSRQNRHPHMPAAHRPRFGDSNLGRSGTAIVAGAGVLFIAFAAIGFLLCMLLGIKGWLQIPVVIAFGAASCFVAVRGGLAFGNGAGQFIARFIAPSGSTTPYEYTFSYQQALAARGDVAGALESYEAHLRETPENIEAYVQAAELYAKSGNAARAIELFRALRNVPTVTSARDIYASQRLVDLYRGGKDEGRALVELRRLVERYPGTDTAARAREALASLKAPSLLASDAPASYR